MATESRSRRSGSVREGSVGVGGSGGGWGHEPGRSAQMMGPDGEVLGSARGGGTTRRDHCSTGSTGPLFPFTPACTLPGSLL